MNLAVESFQVVLDSYRWVPLPPIGFTTNSAIDESQDGATPPPILMEHPPIAVFVNGVSAAMNELRCAPLRLKYKISQEVVKGLQAVSESLFSYNFMRVLRGSESALLLALYQAFIEVAFPYCATSFGRCYPNGSALIMESRNVLHGVRQLVAVSPVKGPKNSCSVDNTEGQHTRGNGNVLDIDNASLVDGEDLKIANSAQSGSRPMQVETESTT